MTTETANHQRDSNGRFVKGNTLGFQKNQVSNPKGRPPNPLCITSRQKEKMLEICPFDPQGRTWIEALSEGGMRQALLMPTALNNLQDRHEGKVTQPVGLVGEIVLRVIDDDRDKGTDSPPA